MCLVFIILWVFYIIGFSCDGFIKPVYIILKRHLPVILWKLTASCPWWRLAGSELKGGGLFGGSNIFLWLIMKSRKREEAGLSNNVLINPHDMTRQHVWRAASMGRYAHASTNLPLTSRISFSLLTLICFHSQFPSHSVPPLCLSFPSFIHLCLTSCPLPPDDYPPLLHPPPHSPPLLIEDSEVEMIRSSTGIRIPVLFDHQSLL